jgi:hypothetical protein
MSDTESFVLFLPGEIRCVVHNEHRNIFRNSFYQPCFNCPTLPTQIIFTENLVEHDLGVVVGVPVTVVIKAAGLFEDAGELHAARAHVVNVGAGGFAAVGQVALLGLAQELASPPRTELFQIVAAINDVDVEEAAGA